MCAALIAIFLLTSSYPGFFDDLLQFMQTDEGNLTTGLEILDSFASNLDQIVIEKKKAVRIKCIILEEIPHKFTGLFEFLLSSNPNKSLQEKTLQTLKSWVGIKLQVLTLTNKLIDELLRVFDENCQESEKLEIITEIIVDSLKNCNHAEILESSSLLNAEKLITENERKNIQKIIEYLGVKKASHFLQNSNNEKSFFCRCYTEIISVLAEKFTIFILENTEFSHAILKLLLMVSAHRNLSISHLTFDFWVSFYQTLNKHVPNIKQSENDFLIAPFVDLFKIIFEKCKMRSFKLKSKDLKAYSSPRKQKNVIHISESDDVLIEEDEENEGNKVTISSYRAYSEDIFYNVYRVLFEFRGQQGVNLFFSLIRERMSKEFIVSQYGSVANNEHELLAEYIISTEAALFATKSMLDNLIFIESNPFIHDILRLIISDLPYEGIVVKTALQFIYDASEQLKFSDDIIENVYKFVLQFIVDQRLGKLSSQVKKYLIKKIVFNVVFKCTHRKPTTNSNECCRRCRLFLYLTKY